MIEFDIDASVCIGDDAEAIADHNQVWQLWLSDTGSRVAVTGDLYEAAPPKGWQYVTGGTGPSADSADETYPNTEAFVASWSK